MSVPMGDTIGTGVAVGGTDVGVGETIIRVDGSDVEVEMEGTGCDDCAGPVRLKSKKTISSRMATISLKRS